MTKNKSIENKLKLDLISTQYALRETRKNKNIQSKSLLVLVNGVELAGKGRAVTQLREWVDPRLLQVEATREQLHNINEPIWQRHIAQVPRHGDVCTYFGNWYADLIYTAMKIAQQCSSYSAQHSARKKDKKFEKSKEANWKDYLSKQLSVLTAFEHDLCENDTTVLKCWFHLDQKILKKKLKEANHESTYLYQVDWLDDKELKLFNDVAREILSQQNDWIIIDGDNIAQAKLDFAHHVLNSMQNAVQASNQIVKQAVKSNFVWADISDELSWVEECDLGKSEYRKKLKKKQQQLAKLIRERDNTRVVFAFEGMDASGKGGAIKRLVAPLDPREYKIHNIAAPMQHELERPYLWRFWNKLPNSVDNRVVIFDRTWYGRVLVERVEGFANQTEWQRAYDEINRYEANLADSNTIIIKYWLAIDKDEQLERFQERKEIPYKKFKLTDEDWRNRDKWQNYVQAASDTLARTNSTHSPWCVIATNDKRNARLMVLDHAINRLLKHKL